MDEIDSRLRGLPRYAAAKGGDMAEQPSVGRCRAIYEILEHGAMDQRRALLADEVVWTVGRRGKFAQPNNGIEEVSFRGMVSRVGRGLCRQ